MLVPHTLCCPHTGPKILKIKNYISSEDILDKTRKDLLYKHLIQLHKQNGNITVKLAINAI